MKTVICKDVFGNEFRVNAEELEQRVGVYAVIIKDEKILLTKQWGGISIVGGGVEKGETLEEAFVREVKEETGLKVKPGRVIYTATTFFKRNVESQPRQSFQFYMIHDGEMSGEIANVGITDSEKTYTDGLPCWIDINEALLQEFRHSVDLKEIIDAYRETMHV